MSPSSSEFWWLFVLGNIALLALVFGFITIIFHNQRKFQKDQQEKLEQLKQSEEKYSNLFNHVTDIVFIHSLDGHIVQINNAVRDLLGYDPRQLIGLSLNEIIAPQFPFDLKGYISEITETGFSHGHIHFKSTMGSVLIFEFRNTVVFRDGSPIAIRGIARNVTEHIKAELKLKTSEERYRNLFQHSIASIVLLDRDLNFIDANKAAIELLGYQRQELLALNFQHIILNRESFTSLFGNLKQSGNLVNLELLLKKRNGSRIWALSNATWIEDSPSQQIGILFTIFDITSRRQAEQLLAEEKERLAVTLRSIGDAIVTTNTLGEILLFNHAAEKLCQISSLEINGKFFEEVFQIVDEQTNERCASPVEEVLKAGQIVQHLKNRILITKDNSQKYISYSSAPIKDKEDQTLGVVLAIRDVTEKIKLEEEVLKMRKLESVGILAGGLAHDFNNILTAIVGNLFLAKMSLCNENTETISLLDDVEKATLQAKKLTQQLLTFSRGGAPIKKTEAIHDLIRDSINFTLRGSNVRCEYFISDDLWPVFGDTGQINQVLNNLVMNSDQAMPEGGILEVHAINAVLAEKSALPLKPGRYIKITIKDTGIGIPAEYLPKIFDPYFSTKKAGNGLGLATVYSIISKHDGYITVESKIGKGTSVIFYLPASMQKIAPLNSPQITLQQGKGRILLMDDELGIREATGKILKKFGYDVDFACEGSEALEKYQRAIETRHPFDLVILDLTIPGGMGGLETIKELLKRDQGAKAIVSSGYSSDPVMANFKQYGFCEFIAKPYNLNELRTKLYKVMNN
ncbi:MAG: PAS domain-containing hybrid sensor histidine kinase/response regulator [Candidatus Zhuqueibacterota bacterium]